MNVSPPTGKDIADLLLLCAPKEALSDFELSEENKGEFSDCFRELPTLVQSEITALALYYANRNLIKFKKSSPLVSSLYISPMVIHSLIQLTQAERSSESGDRAREIAKNAANARHNQINGSNDKRNKIRAIFATGKHGDNRNACAEKEHEKLGMSYKTARNALMNTPDP